MEGVLPSPDRHEGHCPSPTRTPCPDSAPRPISHPPFPARLQPTPSAGSPPACPNPQEPSQGRWASVPALPSHTPASLLLLCRPHSVGGHSSLRSGRGLAPRLPRPSTVNLGPGPTEGSRGTPSSAPPSLPPLPRDSCSPAGRRSPALDLALGLGHVLPCLLQVHGWKVTCDVFFPVTEAAPEVWAVAAGGGASDMGSRVP